MRRKAVVTVFLSIALLAAPAIADAVCGKYRGLVVETNDPLLLGRVQVSVPALLGAATPWATPNVPPGRVALPQTGDVVWVEFEECDLSAPIWGGSPMVECRAGRQGPRGCRAGSP